MRLINGECLEEMRKMESESVDLIVTSPPYDNLRTYNGTNDWNFEVFKPIAKELSRVIKKGGVIVWVVGDATIKGSETGSSFKQALYFKEECGLNLHDTMIYEKSGFPFPMKNRYYQSFEYMFVLSKGKPNATNLISDRKNKYSGDKVARNKGNRQINGEVTQNSANKIDRNRVIKDFGVRFNIWRFINTSSTGDSKKFKHPAMFPEKLAEDHILSWSNEGDIVLDPFMGSGTTGKMALLNNRDFIGIERVEEYFNIAKERINNV